MNWLLIGRFLWRHKAEIGIALVLAGLLYAIGEYGNRRESAGRSAVRVAYAAKEAKATAEHNARIKEINRAHAASEQEMAVRLATALAHPATRTIRVPVSAACPRTIPGDASVPAGADTAGGFVDVVDEGYGGFRDWLYQFAAGPIHGG